MLLSMHSVLMPIQSPTPVNKRQASSPHPTLYLVTGVQARYPVHFS